MTLTHGDVLFTTEAATVITLAAAGLGGLLLTRYELGRAIVFLFVAFAAWVAHASPLAAGSLAGAAVAVLCLVEALTPECAAGGDQP